MPTATAEPVTLTRDDLLRVGRTADSYRFLAMAVPALAQVPDDAELRLSIFRHYANLGLIGPALQVAGGLPSELLALPDIVGAIASLEKVPTGRVAWSRLRDGFKTNLAVLVERFPQLGMIEAVWQETRRLLELYQCRDGSYQIGCRSPAGEVVWLAPVMNGKADAERFELPRDEAVLLPGPLLFEGVGFGWHLDRAARTYRNVFLNYSPALYVVEPDLSALAAVLHLHDWRELLSDPRVYVFGGSGWAEQMRGAFGGEERLPLPAHVIRVPRWGVPCVPAVADVIDEIGQSRVAELTALAGEVEPIYRPRDAAFWARRYREANESDPLRVMLVTSRYTTYLQYCIRDLARAFEAHGCRTRTVIEDADHQKLSAITYQRLVREFQPDLLFMIDHFRHEYGGSLPANVPYVGWIQDVLPNLYSQQAGQSLGPLDFYIACDVAPFVHRYGYPASQGLTWTTATDDRLYSAAPLSEEELAPYRCDFSYVSNQSRPPRAFYDDRRARLGHDVDTIRYADAVFDAVCERFERDPRTAAASPVFLYEKIKQEQGLKPSSPQADEVLRQQVFFPLVELIFRQQALTWIADYCDRTGRTLHIYGNGWDRHPRFAQYARGFAENGAVLRAIYQASDVNLQIIATGAIHQRLLDGLAAGGFFLLRYAPGDMMHHPIRHYLEAIEKHAPEYDRDYDAAEVPELAAAIEERWLLQGEHRRCERVRVRPGVLQADQAAAASGFRKVAGAVFPEYSQVVFADRAECEALADRYLGDPEARRAVADAMRSQVVGRFGYGALVRDLLKLMQAQLEGA